MTKVIDPGEAELALPGPLIISFQPNVNIASHYSKGPTMLNITKPRFLLYFCPFKLQ